MLLTPFAVPSWEPRFALDSMSPDSTTISEGLGLFLRLRQWRVTGEERFVVHATSASRLVLFQKGGFAGARASQGRLVLAEASVADAATAASRWLIDEAEYPPEPWFDGSESRGFQMFDVPYKAHPREFYGAVIVEPKWFEVHK